MSEIGKRLDNIPGIDFIKKNLTYISEVLYHPDTVKTLSDVILRFDAIVNWKIICKLNNIPGEEICNEEGLNKIFDIYKDNLNSNEINSFEYAKIFIKIRNNLKNKNSRLYIFLTKMYLIPNYKFNEFSIFTLIEAINQIPDKKIIKNDIYEIILMVGNEFETRLFIKYLFSVNKEYYLYLREYTNIFQKLIEKGYSKEINELISLKENN